MNRRDFEKAALAGIAASFVSSSFGQETRQTIVFPNEWGIPNMELKYVDRANLKRMEVGEVTYAYNGCIRCCKDGTLAIMLSLGPTYSEASEKDLRQIMIVREPNGYLIQIPDKIVERVKSQAIADSLTNLQLLIHGALPLEKKLGSFWKLPSPFPKDHPKLIEGKKDAEEALQLTKKLSSLGLPQTETWIQNTLEKIVNGDKE